MPATRHILAQPYPLREFYDEMFAAPETVRPHYRVLHEYLRTLTPETFAERRRLADTTFLNQGITVTVYGEVAGVERIFPFDLIPRIIPAASAACRSRSARSRAKRCGSTWTASATGCTISTCWPRTSSWW